MLRSPISLFSYRSTPDVVRVPAGSSIDCDANLELELVRILSTKRSAIGTHDRSQERNSGVRKEAITMIFTQHTRESAPPCRVPRLSGSAGA
jgi:hypothetical protein